MPESETTLTVELEGSDISLSSFVTAVSALDGLLKDLSAEVASGSQLVWEIHDLQVGSASATVRGRAISGDPEAVGRVGRAYEAIGDALVQGAPVPYPDRIRRRVTTLMSVLNDHVAGLRLETANGEYLVTPNGQQPRQERRPLVSLDAVEGRIQAITNRRSLRFTLYDSLNDRAVACYLQPGDEDRMRTLWGRRAIVEGEVHSDPESGRPLVIRHITDVVPLPEPDPDAWRRAEGVLADVWGDEPAGETIRRIRDAS